MGRGARIIVPYQKLLMSVDQQEEHYMPFQSLKIRNQNTTTYNKQSAEEAEEQRPEPESESESESLSDCSFERGIHQENAEPLRVAASRFLEECLGRGFGGPEGFREAGLYENLPFEVGGAGQLESLTARNPLLSAKEQEELTGMLRKEGEVMGLLKELLPVFGATVGKEVVLAVYHILKLKLKSFEALRGPAGGLLPRFPCFFGFEEEETDYTTACPVYEELSLEEVGVLAEEDVEQLATTVYFSAHVEYLTLRRARPDVQCSVFPKFKALLRQLSRTVLFTLAGAVDPASLSGCSLDLSREPSFAEIEGLGGRRSLSRPFVPCEDDEPADFTTKRMKF